MKQTRKKPVSTDVDTESPTQRHPSVIVTLPLIESATDLLLDCVSTGGIGLIAGPAGTGKTVALKRLEARYQSHKLPGQCLYFCCQSNAGATRGVKDILIEHGLGGPIIAHGQGGSMQTILKVVLREFKRRDIRCLLLDESQRLDSEAMLGIVAMLDYLRANDHPVAAVIATMKDNPEWLSPDESAATRTLRTVRSHYIQEEDMLGMLALWSDEFHGFSAKVDEEDQEALQISSEIHRHTGGNLRRLNFFLRLYNSHHSGTAVTSSTVTSTLARLASQNDEDSPT